MKPRFSSHDLCFIPVNRWPGDSSGRGDQAGQRKHTGKVAPENFRKEFDAARTAARITEWPDNALRHSFASYHLAHFKDAKALALEMGHTTTTLIFSNYRQLVKPKEAEKYWNIKPIKPESEEDIVQFVPKG